MINSIFRNIFESANFYGIFCTLGITVSVIVALILSNKENLEFFNFVLVAIITLFGALIGAKLMFLIVSIDTIIKIFQQLPLIEALKNILRGGFVFYGGFIGGFIALLITLKIQKENFFKYANIYALVLPIGHAFGRVGCFFAGCCYGMEYDGWLSYTYTHTLESAVPLNVPLLPIQLIEAFLLVVLFHVLFVMYFKVKNKKLISYTYLYSYAIIRFILEFFRGDKIRGVFVMSTSQWISIAIILLTTGYLIFNHFKKQKNINKDKKVEV